MIRILSITQARALRDTIPELALRRSLQFQGHGYDPDRDGHIIVLEEGDTLELFDEDDLPLYEYAELLDDCFEIVFQIDDSRTLAYFIPDSPRLNPRLKKDLIRSTQS